MKSTDEILLESLNGNMEAMLVLRTGAFRHVKVYDDDYFYNSQWGRAKELETIRRIDDILETWLPDTFCPVI